MQQKKFDALLPRSVRIPVIMLAVFAALFLWETQSLRKSMDRLDHTDQVISADRELIKQTVDMEAGLRGYLIAGEEQYLQPYTDATSVMNTKFAALKQLVSTDTAQLTQLTAIQSSFNEWREVANDEVQLHRGGGGQKWQNYEADNLLLQQLMHSTRVGQDAFAATEEGLRRISVRRAYRINMLVIVTCMMLVLLGGYGVVFFANREMTLRDTDFTMTLATAKKHADALREQADLLDLAHDTIVVRALNGTIQFWNHGAEEMYGYSKQEATGQTSQELLHTIYPEPLDRIEEKLVRAGRWEGEILRTVQDGKQVMMATRWVPQLDKGGQICGVMEISSDITEQKRDELRLSEIIRVAMDAIIALDANRCIVLFNPAAEKMFGCPAHEAIGESFERFVPSYAQIPRDEYHEMASPELTYGLSTSYGLRENGLRFPLEGTISQVTVAGERLFTVILHDITQRREAEEELREKEARFRSLYEYAAVGIAQVATNGAFLMVNPALCKMLGYSRAELQMTTEEGITQQTDWARERPLQQSMLLGDRDFYEIEKSYIHRSGATVSVNVTSSIVKDIRRRALYCITVVQETTRRKWAEDQLQQAHKMEAIGRLAGGVAHDFNNLLTVIMGYSEVALDELSSNDPSYVRFKEIRSSAETGAALTRQFLAFSRKQVIATRVIDLREIVMGLEPMIRRLLPEDIQIAFDCSPESCPVEADPTQLKQVLLNLVVNAGDAMPRGGKLTIDVRGVMSSEEAQQDTSVKSGPLQMLTVTDTGCGMDAETVAQIFEPFFTTKPVGEGTGLGLATLYGIVQQCGGTVRVHSELGQGSIFKVWLPQALAPLTASETVHLGLHRSTGTETILLVDDCAPLLKLMRGVLSGKGYTVLAAEDGVQALELSKSYAGIIDVLITDVVMPHLGGTELAEHIVRDRPDIKLIFASGYSTDKYVMPRDASGGRTTTMEKPYKPETLLRTVRQVLDERQ